MGIKMVNSNRHEQLTALGVLAAIVLGLYLSSLYSYLLFHSLVEIVTIAIAFTLFILTWNTRKYLTNNYLKLLGIGYAFIAFIDLLHTLAYKGMSVFPGYGANLPTQLWIAARYLQAVTLLAAPLLANRKLDNRAVFGGYAAAVSVLVAVVYAGHFPDCFIEGKGLTTFKIGSEYLISALLLVALYLLFRKREYFNDRVFLLAAASIGCTALSEISFTAYASVYGFANLVGHFAKLAAFYLIYRAILVTGLMEPFDLTFRELKRAEEELRKSQETLEEKVREQTAELRASGEKYQSLIRKVGTAIVLHDGQGRILDSNPSAQQLLGLSAEQLLGKSLIDPYWHFLREDGSQLPVAEYPVSRVLATRQPLKDQVAGIRHPDRDEVRWVLVNGELEYDEAGEIARIITSFVDITGRKQTEAALFANHEELIKSERELNEAQRLAHIGSWDWDAVNDTIWWSDEYYRIYGIDPDLTPPNYQEHLKVYTAESATRLDAAVQRSMTTGESYEVDLELAQPTATTHWIVARGEVKKAADGKIIGLRGSAQDITEQKLTEAKITALNEELEKRVVRRTEDLQLKSRELQESQLALMNIVEDLNEKSRELEQANLTLQGLDRLKSMFVASMSHELRTPLNSIIGFSTVILEEWLGPLNAEQKAKVAIVLRTGKHLLSLINDVIDVSKIEAGKLESHIEDFDLRQVVDEALALVRKDGEEKGLRFIDATNALTLHNDRRRFFQCLVNLLGNAVKFSNRGEVVVASALVPGGPGRPDSLRISVRDCGIGIPEAELPKLFTAFTRIQSELSGTVKGTGLGLYLVKKITTEILQGQVGVESTAGQGSIFYLTVPLRIEERGPEI